LTFPERLGIGCASVLAALQEFSDRQGGRMIRRTFLTTSAALVLCLGIAASPAIASPKSDCKKTCKSNFHACKKGCTPPSTKPEIKQCKDGCKATKHTCLLQCKAL
jgi:hypothetical protein